MFNETGHFALVLALALALVQSALPLWGSIRRDLTLMGTAVPIAVGQFALVAYSFACLTEAHVASDFDHEPWSSTRKLVSIRHGKSSAPAAGTRFPSNTMLR